MASQRGPGGERVHDLPERCVPAGRGQLRPQGQGDTGRGVALPGPNARASRFLQPTLRDQSPEAGRGVRVAVAGRAPRLELHRAVLPGIRGVPVGSCSALGWYGNATQTSGVCADSVAADAPVMMARVSSVGGEPQRPGVGVDRFLSSTDLKTPGRTVRALN